jgi:hypothetical protein
MKLIDRLRVDCTCGCRPCGTDRRLAATRIENLERRVADLDSLLYPEDAQAEGQCDSEAAASTESE